MNDTAAVAALRIIPDAEYDRRKYLGGSNAAAIMGVGATYDGIQQTPYTCYQAKVGETPEDMSPGRQLFLSRRKRWEGPIVEMLREEFAGNIIAVNRRYVDPEFDFLAAEIDFEWADENGEIQNGEIKTVSPFAFGEHHGWGEAGSGDIPVHYAAQVLHGLSVTGRQTCIIAALAGLDTMIFYRIDRDEETIAWMRERMAIFWQEYVLPRHPPDPVNLSDVMAYSLRLRGKPVEIDDAIFERLGQLRNLRETAKIMDGDESQIKFEILDFIRRAWLLDPGVDVKDDAALLYRGVKVASYNRQSATRIDAERLRAEEPDIAAHFSKTSETRVLRLTKPK